MAITLTLSPQEEAKLAALARARGVSTDVLVREALENILGDGADLFDTSNDDSRPIWEIILENMKDVPAEEFAKLPTDGATELDHYLYGHPKRHR
jgi:hypothetical protein